MSERLNGIKTVLSDEEDVIITYLSRKLGIKKSILARTALMDWAAGQLDKLSALDELTKRAEDGQRRGKVDHKRDHLSVLNQIQASLDELRRNL